MSVSIAMQAGGEVSLFSDAAHYTADGTIVGFGSKIVELPNAGCAIIVRDKPLPPEDFGELFGHVTHFDDLPSEIERSAPLLLERLQERHAPYFDPRWNGLELVMAGFSKKRGRPVVYLVVTTHLERNEG